MTGALRLAAVTAEKYADRIRHADLMYNVFNNLITSKTVLGVTLRALAKRKLCPHEIMRY